MKGIQEHTFLLELAITEAKKRHDYLHIVWLDLANAFGSLPHSTLNKLFESLPLPAHTSTIFKDMYTNTICEYKDFMVQLTSGVRQGDCLSPIIFNLASEPIIRKAIEISGYDLFGSKAKLTANADDLAIITGSHEEMMSELDGILEVSSSIGIKFNPRKCTSISFNKGVIEDRQFMLCQEFIKTLHIGEFDRFLGIPIGSKFLFNVTTDIPAQLNQLSDFGLTPWQKIEVLRSHLIPSLSHELSSGRVMKESIYDLDKSIKQFLRYNTNTPDNVATPFFYADRHIGGLGIGKISQEVDIWTISKATQLLSSRDNMISSIANRQLSNTINCAIGHDHEIPLTEFLSGSQTHGLYGYRFYSKGANLWTRTRHAATHLGARIDISDGNIIIAIDDICSTPAKVLKSMRLALRKQWSRKCMELPLQGSVAECLSQDANYKVITKLISQESTLSFKSWNYWHMARTQTLPVKAFPGSTDKKCRQCYSKDETTMHILNMCTASLKMMTERHDAVLGVLTKFLDECDIEYDTSYISLDNLKPDLVIKYNNSCYFVDITIPYDSITNMESAVNSKIEKYRHLGYVIPFCVGSLGSWYSGNQILKTEMNFPTNTWKILKTASIKESIEGSGRILSKFFNCF